MNPVSSMKVHLQVKEGTMSMICFKFLLMSNRNRYIELVEKLMVHSTILSSCLFFSDLTEMSTFCP